MKPLAEIIAELSADFLASVNFELVAWVGCAAIALLSVMWFVGRLSRV